MILCGHAEAARDDPSIASPDHLDSRLFRGQFAYVDGQLPDSEILPLCRLRCSGSASRWGFAVYRASHDDYQDNYLPSGDTTGSPEEALDCACGLYLNDPTAWRQPDTPQN